MKKNQLSILLFAFLLAGGLLFFRMAWADPLPNQFAEGALLRSQKSSVYYVGADKKLHPFLHPSVFHSWHDSLEKVEIVPDRVLRGYQIGEPVCVRSGTWLVKFNSVPRIYAVEPGCIIRPLRSETEAVLFYGSEWQRRVIELDTLQSNFYTIRSFSAADTKTGVIDKDGDGIPVTMEREYGTSDGLEDFDGDTVSDYEEIYFWATDPTKNDTDGDGKKDGQEIQNQDSPRGSQRLTAIPTGTYTLPRGAAGASALFSRQGIHGVPEESWSAAVDLSRPTVTRQGQLMQL